MFSNLFSRKENISKTGFYEVKDKELVAINELPGNGSMNNVIESLGYPENHIHIVFTFGSDTINCLGFKALSKNLVLVLAKNPETRISFSDVAKEVNTVDWSFEYSSLRIEDILKEGIEKGNFNLDFLNSVIDLVSEGNEIYMSKQLGLYLQFENGILRTYTSSNWNSASTKLLKGLNEGMVRKMTEEARLYHNNEMDITEEVNKQTDAILKIPDAVKNKYVPLHQKNNNNINFYNLLITHYTHSCELSEFLLMNKGRYNLIGDNTYEVGNFIYQFSFDNKLSGIFNKQNN